MGRASWEVQVAEFHCSILGLLSCLCGKATLLPSRAITRKLKMLYQWHFSGLPQEHRNLPLISTHMHRRTHTHTHTHKTKTNCASSFGLGVNINFLSVAYSRDLLLLSRETDNLLILIGPKMRRCEGKRSTLSYYTGGDYAAVHLYLSNRLYLQHGMAKWVV